ncbi:MAG: class I SAM-dependent methyltransferase [Candidatus Geothermincolia bacterium]
MIIHKLIYRHLRHGDDEGFYRLQAAGTVSWLLSVGFTPGPSKSALDLGCGFGLIGGGLLERGCHVVFADESNWLLPEYACADFRLFDIEKDDAAGLGSFDLVISSNVLEHISDPGKVISLADRLLKPGGLFYLSWTNALSPWWGHEFSPLHYLGARRGARIFDRMSSRQRKHVPYVNLFPYSIGRILKMVRAEEGLEVVRLVPRYYPELACLMRIPVLREFLAWNSVVLIRKRQPAGDCKTRCYNAAVTNNEGC